MVVFIATLNRLLGKLASRRPPLRELRRLGTPWGCVVMVSRVEAMLKDHAAIPHVKELVNAGCERGEIIALLELAFWTDESWQQLIEMNLPRFKREISQIRHCAGILDRLNRSELIYHASIELRLPQFVEIHKSPTLPGQLRTYADGLDLLRKVLGPKARPRWHAWKAWIVALVTEDTKAPHDREVASLIGAVLNLPDYSEKAHQRWRLDHIDLIELMRSKVLENRAKRRSRSMSR